MKKIFSTFLVFISLTKVSYCATAVQQQIPPEPQHATLHPVSSIWDKAAANNPYPDRKKKIECFTEDCTKAAELNNNIPTHTSNDRICRIATYNVHHWANPSEVQNLTNILQVIRTVNADILILQEVKWGLSWWWGLRKGRLKETFETIGYPHQLFSRYSWCSGAPL